MTAARELVGYTIADIEALPEGERAELIDGVIYDMSPPPSSAHQRLSGDIQYIITKHIKKNKGKCEVFAAPFAVYLDEVNNQYVEPDISVICDTTKIDHKGCHGAPDWIIEIISQATAYKDRNTKRIAYMNAEVREYWIVDPNKKTVEATNFENKTSETYTFEEQIPAGIFDGLVIELSYAKLYS